MAGKQGDQAAGAAQPAACRREEGAGVTPVVPLETLGEVAPQRRAPPGIGNGLAADAEDIGHALAGDLPEGGRGQQPALALRGPERDRP